MTHNEMIEVIAAHRDGKKIEKQVDINIWMPVATLDYILLELSRGLNIRIAPEPKKRLMTPRELAGKWINTLNNNDIHLVTGVNDNGYIHVMGYWQDIDREWQYTTTPQDDSSWRSVEVEVSE